MIFIYIGGFLLLSAISVACFMGGKFYRKAIIRPSLKKRASLECYTPKKQEKARAALDWLAAKASEERVITNDGLKLRAYYVPAENPVGTVVCVHGYKSFGALGFADSGDFLLDAGLNLLIIDQRAHGLSEGRHACYGVLECDDICKWCADIPGPVFLFGRSMGCTSVLLAAGRLRVNGIIADCGFTSAYEVLSLVIKRDLQLPLFPMLPTAMLFTRLFAHFNMKGTSTVDVMRQCHTPVLFIHGGSDKLVPVEMTMRAYAACAAPKRLLIVNDAPHCRSVTSAPQVYSRAVIDFINQYLSE